MISVYLAGPAVFRRDAGNYAVDLRRKCQLLGLDPLWPLDNGFAGSDAAALAREIRLANCDMITRSTCVVADISPFRGPNMDPGTGFEIGYAAALRKPIFLYSSSSLSLLQRTGEAVDLTSEGTRVFDPNDMEVEDFGLPENLMIATCVDRIHDSVEAALAAVVVVLARTDRKLD